MCTALCLGKACEGLSNLTVRFISDEANNACIAFGEETTHWTYPVVKIHDILLGHQQNDYTSWRNSWEIFITESLSLYTVHHALSNTHIGYGCTASSCTGNAATADNAAKVGNMPVSHLQVCNTIVTRDSNGYTYLNYINCNTSNNENPAISQILVTNGSDNFFRKASLFHLKTQMGLNNVNNTADSAKSVHYAASAGNADTVDGHHFNWSGQSGQPTWLWGGNDSTNMYVYNPSNFSVSYANTAGSAAKATQDGNGRNIVNTYLPRSGGWMDGVLYVGNTDRCIQFWGNGMRIYAPGNNHLCIRGVLSGRENIGVDVWIGDGAGDLDPASDNSMYLGVPSLRWKQVYAVSSTISTSDERLKDNIRPLDERLTHDFFMRLNPISYRSKEGDSGRTHYGLGAQSVEKAMKDSGMTSMDFAGFIKSPITEEIEIEEVQKRMEQREIPGKYRYGLRYEEFISPLIKMVQMQQRQLEVQMEKIQEIQTCLKAMTARLDAIEA